jgi:hypothetical protein
MFLDTFSDVNECDQNVCLNSATCINTNGSYFCTCASGWQGQHCDEGKKKEPNAVSSKISFIAVNSPSNTFRSFWVCVLDIDECLLNPCHRDREICNNSIGSYSCSCVAGWIGDDCDQGKQYYPHNPVLMKERAYDNCCAFYPTLLNFLKMLSA